MENTLTTESSAEFSVAELNDKINRESAFVDLIKLEMNKVIIVIMDVARIRSKK